MRGVSPRSRRSSTTLELTLDPRSLSGDEPCVKGNKISSHRCEFHMDKNTAELCGVFAPPQRSCSIAQPRELNFRCSAQFIPGVLVPPTSSQRAYRNTCGAQETSFYGCATSSVGIPGAGLPVAIGC